MGDVVVFRDRRNIAHFDCESCGSPVWSSNHQDDRPICATCRFLERHDIPEDVRARLREFPVA